MRYTIEDFRELLRKFEETLNKNENDKKVVPYMTSFYKTIRNYLTFTQKIWFLMKILTNI